MRKATSSKASAREVDALYESVMSCAPVVSPEDVERYADLVFSKEHVIRAWRAAAFFGSKGGEFYKELSNDKEKARAAAPIVEPLKHTAKLIRDMADIMDSVSARISVAGCNHRDFDKWAKEASHD